MKMLTPFLMFIILFSSCHRYYIPSAVQGDVQQAVTKFREESRHFVLRDSIFNYEMKNVEVSKGEIRCSLQRLSGLKRIANPRRSGFHYYYRPSREDSLVDNEVHIFTSRTLTNGSDTEISIPFSSVKNIEQLNFDKRKTTNNHLVMGILTVSAVASIAVLVSIIEVVRDLSTWGD